MESAHGWVYNHDRGGSLPPMTTLSIDGKGLPVMASMACFMEQTGYFKPDSGDKVFLRGDIIPGGWGPGTEMTENQLEPGYYSANVNVISTPNDTTGYKYFIQTTRTVPPLPPNGGWEEGPHGANYPLVFTGRDSTLPTRFFDGITGVLKTPVTVIFSVNMKHAIDAITGKPFPSIDSVVLGGSEPSSSRVPAGSPSSRFRVPNHRG